MSVYVRLFGHRLFAEYARWARPGGTTVAVRRENGEFVVWIGRLNIIHTPARWAPPPRLVPGGLSDAGPRPP